MDFCFDANYPTSAVSESPIRMTFTRPQNIHISSNLGKCLTSRIIDYVKKIFEISCNYSEAWPCFLLFVRSAPRGRGLSGLI